MKCSPFMPLTLLVLIILLLSGCSNSKMDQNTYDRIQIGMTLSEVENYMGFDSRETLVCIDETKSSSFIGHQITHHDLRVNDKDKVARYSYIPRNEPAVLIVVYSYSTQKERKSITVKFDKIEEKVIAKECVGL